MPNKLLPWLQSGINRDPRLNKNSRDSMWNTQKKIYIYDYKLISLSLWMNIYLRLLVIKSVILFFRQRCGYSQKERETRTFLKMGYYHSRKAPLYLPSKIKYRFFQLYFHRITLSTKKITTLEKVRLKKDEKKPNFIRLNTKLEFKFFLNNLLQSLFTNTLFYEYTIGFYLIGFEFL